jgi:hypothetical protein
MAHAILEGWTAGGVLRWSLILAVLYFVIDVFCESNVRHFIEEHKWDTLLTRAIRKMEPLKKRRGFWFAFGLTFGATVVAWAPLYTATSSAEPFVNPLHEDRVKWKIAEGVRSATIAGMLSTQCHATIVSLQDPYAQDYAADFKRILDVINWKYDGRFAAGPIDRGISVGALADQVQSRACAITLARQLSAYLRNRYGAPLNVVLKFTTTDEAPGYLKQCPEGLCIEVNFGNDDSH